MKNKLSTILGTTMVVSVIISVYVVAIIHMVR